MSEQIKEVWVRAQNCVALKALSDPEDKEVRGLYSVKIHAALGRKKWASAALDVFHSNKSVGTIDEFEFTVIDPVSKTVLEEDPDHESYSLSRSGGDVWRLPAALMGRIYRVTLVEIIDDGSRQFAGEACVLASNRNYARHVGFVAARPSDSDPLRYRIASVQGV